MHKLPLLHSERLFLNSAAGKMQKDENKRVCKVDGSAEKILLSRFHLSLLVGRLSLSILNIRVIVDANPELKVQ